MRVLIQSIKHINDKIDGHERKILPTYIIFLCREIRVDLYLVEEKVMENGF